MKSISIALSVVLLAALLAVVGCGPSAAPEAEADATAEDIGPESSGDDPEVEEAPEPLTGKHVVIMKTTKGTITMELDADKAPNTVENFLKYVDRKFYDHTIFHRVIKNYVIQGGGFTRGTGGMQRKLTRDPIDNESANGLKNLRGTVAMARGKDPHSASSQFFINLRDNSRLNKGHPKGDGWGYCVFGKVIEGMDIADAIGSVKTGPLRSYENVPVVPVFISSIRLAPPDPEGEG